MVDKRDPLAGIGPLDSPPSKAKRTRTWEKKNKPRSYRGIPAETHERVLAIAEEYRVPVGELVAFLMQDGAKRIEDGELKINPVPIIGANTLFPGRR